jgi:hypothetical protein
MANEETKTMTSTNNKLYASSDAIKRGEYVGVIQDFNLPRGQRVIWRCQHSPMHSSHETAKNCAERELRER